MFTMLTQTRNRDARARRRIEQTRTRFNLGDLMIDFQLYLV